MKSKEKKNKVKRQIVTAALELMSESGYKAVSMRMIAKQANIGDATIYNYFANKEKILVAIFELKFDQTLQEIEQVEDFEEFGLQEKVQCLLETNLSLLIEDREFIAEAADIAFSIATVKTSLMAGFKRRVNETFADYLEQSYQAEEFEPQAGSSFIASLFWDYYLGVIMYWLNDDSEEFTQTTQLIDLSTALALSILQSGVLNKAGDMMSFLFRHHMFSGFEYLTKAMGSLRPLRRG